MPQLKELKCVPCRGDSPPLTQAEIILLKPQVSDWAVIEVEGIPRLLRVFKFQELCSGAGVHQPGGRAGRGRRPSPGVVDGVGQSDRDVVDA